MTALEVLVDEMCTALPLDPIEFRRRNALKPGERTMTGNTYDDSIRTPEILDKLEQHAIWRERAADKARGKEAGILVGTGVACAHKNYGTGADCSLGAVEIDQQGRIVIRIDDTEMGTGLGTAVANRVAHYLGGVADEVALAQIDAFGPLALVKSGDPYTIDQKTQDAAARNPRWVPEISSATAASTGAHVGTHAAAEAARVIFRFGLWPAALDFWRIGPKDPRAARWQTARWKDGQLTAPGLAPLALSDVAARAHAKNGVTGAMAHGFNRWAWSQADFKIDGQNWTADIDALAMRRGAGKFVLLDRTSVKFPPTDFTRIGTTYTTKCGTLVRVEINRSTGALRIAKAYSVFECGTALVPEVVIGQAQGAFAMGVGGAFLETLPLYEDGPGNGKWNLGQYLVARGSDLPLRDLEIEVLPPVEANERPKGMAEVVMNPVIAAVLNAIFDATGHRFGSLPVTQEMIKGVLT
jgi:CO/xanthine dehydrogenase Mo-binding subunit